jgi:hypothetical protein
MNRKAVLFTASSFLIFIGFVALIYMLHNQQNNYLSEMSTLVAADSVFYEFDSIEHGISKFAIEAWNVTIWKSSNKTNVDVWTNVPVSIDYDAAERFMTFAQQNSRHEINSSIDFGTFRITPQNITVETTTSGIRTTPIDSNSSLGQIRGYQIDIYWNGTSDPITSNETESQNGIDVTINVHAESGQKLRTYQKKLDPYSRSVIELQVSTGNSTPKSSKMINVSINTPGKLEIIPEQGTSFYMLERITLKESNQTTSLVFKNTTITVVDHIFEVWKKGEVKI